MGFKEFLKFDTTPEKLEEAIKGIENVKISNIIPKTLAMVAQAHVWHLLIKSGQKHMALNELYTNLDSEVDGLAEKFIGQGGIIQPLSFEMDIDASFENILNKVDLFRVEVSDCISSVKNNSELQSILDGLIDLQEVIDSFTYKFKLN